MLLWDVLFRGQLGVSLTFIEELYARNLGNLFVSPLTLPEYIAGQLAMSVAARADRRRRRVHLRVSAVPLSRSSRSASRCSRSSSNLLVFGWAIGLAMSGMIMRLGLGAEELAWAAIFIVAPISGVYYPIARAARRGCRRSRGRLPSAHVFEGMRARAAARRVPLGRSSGSAAALNVVYLALGAAVFAWAVRYARNHGTLLQMGE